MRKVNRRIALAIMATGLAGGAYAFFVSPLVPTAMAGWKQHPRLEKANLNVKEAIAALKAAPHDFHGHRKDAVEALEKVQHQLAICAEVKGKAEPDLSTLAAHPKLDAAMEAMKDARAYLKEAPHDFHGHRIEAIGIIDEGIHQVELCLKE